MCDANKLTGQLDLIRVRKELISLFGQSDFSVMFSCLLLDYSITEITSKGAKIMKILSPEWSPIAR